MKYFWIILTVLFVGCAVPTQPDVVTPPDLCSDSRFVGEYKLDHLTGISTYYFDGTCEAAFKYFNKSDHSVWYDNRYISVTGSKVSISPSGGTSVYIGEFGEFKDAEYSFVDDTLIITNSSKTFIFTRSE